MGDPDYWTVQAMKRWGGGFVRALAEAIVQADEDNLARIKRTWPEYLLKYGLLGEQLRLLEEAQETRA